MDITLIEVFLRILPEQILFIWGSYMLSGKKIDIKKMLLSSFIIAMAIYPTRLLPAQFGIHTLLSLVMIIFINIKVNKFKVVKAIQVTVFLIILLFLSEMANVLLITFVLKADVKSIFNDPTLKTLYGLPSLAIFGILSFVIGKALSQRKNLS